MKSKLKLLSKINLKNNDTDTKIKKAPNEFYSIV